MVAISQRPTGQSYLQSAFGLQLTNYRPNRRRIRPVATQTKRAPEAGAEPAASAKPSKKDHILTLAASGLGDVADIPMMTQSRPSYVGSVLQEAGFHPGYFDLYTSTNRPMNVYSKFFAGQLGFKDVEAARTPGPGRPTRRAGNLISDCV
jgi:hypothetical protein